MWKPPGMDGGVEEGREGGGRKGERQNGESKRRGEKSTHLVQRWFLSFPFGSVFLKSPSELKESPFSHVCVREREQC